MHLVCTAMLWTPLRRCHPCVSRSAAREPPFLEPFLESLTVHGMQVGVADYRRIATALQARADWTLPGLRALLTALLARDPEQARELPARFDRFFEHRPLPAGASLDRERVLRELHALVAAPSDPVPEDRPEPDAPASRPRDPHRFPRWLAILLALIALAGAGLIAALLWPPAPVEPKTEDVPVLPPVPVPQPPAPADQAPAPAAKTPLEPAPPPIPTARFHHADLRLTPVPFVPDQTWRTPAAVATAALLALFLYGTWLWQRSRIPPPARPDEDPEKPRLFSISEVGGTPAPRLDADTLDAVADALGHTLSPAPGERLDPVATVRATLARYGIPHLVFQPRRRARGLLLLVDAHAAALRWNPMAAELAAGLKRRGVACTLGRFRGDPERFTTDEGREEHLEDWEDCRTSHLLLVVSDAHGLDPARRRLVLERLRHWPLLAWLDPREPRAWDAFTLIPAAAGIPLYPLTARGVLGAVLGLVGEQGAGSAAEPDQGPRVRAGLPDPPHRAESGLDAPGLAAYLELTLGDALPWAQVCTLVQPMPTGLAERLRERFFPDLPAAAIERLHTLPGTSGSVAGLHVSLEVQGALRRGLEARRDPGWRRAVIDFLLAEFDRAEPKADPDSLRRLAWELARERLALEGNPDNPDHARRLAELAQTSLGRGLRDSLALTRGRLPPLLGQPRDRDARAWLSSIPGNPLGLRPVRHRPLGPGRWAVVGLLSALALGAGGLGYRDWGQPAGPGRIALDWQVQGQPPADLHTLVQTRLPGEDWHEHAAAPGQPTDIPAAPANPGRRYRLALVAGGAVHPVAEWSGRAERLGVTVDWDQAPRPCREPTEVPGLERWDCPDDTVADAPPRPGWRLRLGERAPAGRVLSIALALRDSGHAETADALGARLLASGSVDRVYRLSADPRRPESLTAMLERIGEDLGPALAHAQVLVYGDAALLGTTGRAALADAARAWGLPRRLILPGAPAAWDVAYAPVLRLLEPGRATFEPCASQPAPCASGRFRVPERPEVVTEEELLASIEAEPILSQGSLVLLARSDPLLIRTVFRTSPEDTRIALEHDGLALAAHHGEPVMLEPGVWQVRTQAAGHQPRAFEVDVGPNTVSKPIEVTLLPVDQPKPAALVAESPASTPPPKVRLTVAATPPGARVRIMNIKAAYRPAMALDPGRYDIEVSAPGFQTNRQWYQLGEDRTLGIVLAAAKVEPPPEALTASTAAVIAAPTPEVQMFHDTLKDGTPGPEMVSLPGGAFTMGDIQGIGEHDERPVHQVTVAPFAIGRYEVTFDEYDRFARTAGKPLPDDRGWGRGRRPVINVSYHDASAYANWLSTQTGYTYRLPTEAEWEYAARAGTQTDYWWGKDIGNNRAACSGCGAEWGWNAKQMTAPVGSFAANPFKLFDTAGNVWEFTCSKYSTYSSDSEYAHPWRHQDIKCYDGQWGHSAFVVRGGDWSIGRKALRSANRAWLEPSKANYVVGVRLARTL